MGNCSILTSSASEKSVNQNKIDSSYTLISRKLIYEWTDDIQAALEQLLRQQYHFPHELFVLFLSYIDKEYKIYSQDTTVPYPIYVPTDLMTYPVLSSLRSNSTSKHDIKMALHGFGGVGKSAITFRYLTGNFLDEYDPTLEDRYTKKIAIDDKQLLLEIRDTAMTPEFVGCRVGDDWWISITHVHLIVFAMNELQTFNEVDTYFRKIVRELDISYDYYDEDSVPIILVGNKSDLKDKYCVSLDIAIEYAKERKIPFIQTSAKENANIDLLFQLAVRYGFRCHDLLEMKQKR